MSNQVVRVKREAIAACMTCPLCNKLLRDATTISECLHTFCRKCIYKKLSDEELECCPICDIDLGCVPLEKLRPDHNLQDVRAKIFPFKRRKVDAPEVVPSVALPARRKERSLSSLVVSTPRVSAQTALTGRRSKVTARKTLRGSSFSVEKQIKKEEDSEEDPESSSSRETLTKLTQNIRQNSSVGEPSSLPRPDKETENGADKWEGEGKVDLWKPLNFLVEVANRSKSSKFTSQGSTSKPEPIDEPKIEGLSRKTKQKSKVQNEKGSSDMGPLESVKPKKSRKIHQKKAATFGESGVSPQAVLDASSVRCERKFNPIWCSLVASEDQEGYERLPQISASFLRIKRRQTEEPELPSIEAEPLPTSTPTSKPTTDTSSSQGTPTTFWPRSLSEVFPFVQLEHFKLPGDDEQFNGYTSEEYLVAYIKAQCQANAILARAIRPLASATKKEAQLKTDVELLGDEVQGLRSELKKEKDLHAETRNKGTHTERQTSELKKLHYHLQQEYVGLDNRAKEIIKENELLSEENKDQEKAIHALEDKITGLHGQMVSLIRENNTLGHECADAKQLAIKEYEESPALADKIMTQFTEGYEAYREKAREKLIAAGLDVAVLDSSDEESEVEDDAKSS